MLLLFVMNILGEEFPQAPLFWQHSKNANVYRQRCDLIPPSPPGGENKLLLLTARIMLTIIKNN